jgi:hypothetical protein
LIHSQISEILFGETKKKSNFFAILEKLEVHFLDVHNGEIKKGFCLAHNGEMTKSSINQLEVKL